MDRENAFLVLTLTISFCELELFHHRGAEDTEKKKKETTNSHEWGRGREKFTAVDAEVGNLTEALRAEGGRGVFTTKFTKSTELGKRKSTT